VVEERVRKFILEELRWDRRAELTNDYPLIDGQVLDSLGIYQLVSFLESEFGVEILDQELIPENFGTIGDVARLVAAKRGN
jgi:acyl carrier protein